jgi:hypothetical protein
MPFLKIDSIVGDDDYSRITSSVALKCGFMPQFRTRKWTGFDRRTDEEREGDYGKVILWVDKDGCVCKPAIVFVRF